MEKSKKRLLVILGIVLLVGLILMGIFLGGLSRRGKALNSRPLVLILDPGYGEQIKVGDGVIVHATAREDVGLLRMELWVNDVLVDSVDANISEGPAPTNLTLLSSWIPGFDGVQQIIVRAFSSDEVAGQAMVEVLVEDADELTHLVEEGETLESIAEEYGSSAEELSELNPDLGGGAPEPGDSLIVPDDEPREGSVPGAGGEDGGEPPEPEGEEPFSGWVFPLFYLFGADDGNATLRLEVPALRTGESFGSLHCYVSLADSLPQWYPDLDNNQATDETFEAGIDGWWITDGILVGESAPIISWPMDQPLPMSIACVGVAGGTEALDLGVIALEIPPEEWDGIRHSYESDGEGGHLLMDIKVTELAGDPRNTPKYPDPYMSKPTNVRLNEEDHTLEWDFEAAEGEEIDGFRIYLNGNLHWSVPADERSTRLPPEWFRPPCAWTYTFGVTAYRIGFPDGPESDPPSEFELTQPREGCMRIMRVTFLELETFDLGSDGDHERRHGDVGPAYGYFYANDASVSFDHGHEGPGLDMVEGLSHNTTYDLAVVSGDRGWHFDGPNSIITEVPFGGELSVGYMIWDRDNNPDDLLCDGFFYPIRDAWGQLDGYHREAMTSVDGRCRVTFEYEPTEDSPVGERYVGAEPLPWIDLAAFYIDAESERAHIGVENTGTAAWVDKDLMVEMQTRDGHSLGVAIFADFNLAVGESTGLTHPLFDLEPPYDACVVIDPFDEVLEYYEQTGALIHQPICPDLPDLVVEQAYLSTHAGNYFIVDVRNRGDGPVAYRDLVFEFRGVENRLVTDPYTVADAAIAAGRTQRFEIPVGDTVNRIELSRGWSVTLNPDQIFVESDFSNNTKDFHEGAELELNWYGVSAPYGTRDFVEFHLDAYILQGRTRTEHVVNMDLTQDIDWGTCGSTSDCSLNFNPTSVTSPAFLIIDGETLEVVIQINHPGSLWENYTLTEVFDEPNWEAGSIFTSMRSCTFWPTRDDIGRHAHRWYREGAEWWLRYDLCLTELE